jgi:hypothetical protein
VFITSETQGRRLPKSKSLLIALFFLKLIPLRDNMWCSTLRFIDEFQWFLMELSVRPGKRFAISAQRLPNSWCARRIALSSSSVHVDFTMSGFK